MSENGNEYASSPPAEPSNSQQSSAPDTSSQPPKHDKSNTVFIGKKPLMAYVTSTLLQLTEIPSINIRARGMSISRAVDVAQIVSRKQDNAGYSIGAIELDSETLESTDGKQRNVSTINIVVNRN